jgi:hypothetical protein
MFGLIRLVFWLFIAAIVVWFSTTVQLGSRTLWGHLRAIGATKEAQDFAEGTKQEAKKVAEKLFEHPDAGAHPKHPSPPLDDPSDADRNALDKLTKKKSK